MEERAHRSEAFTIEIKVPLKKSQASPMHNTVGRAGGKVGLDARFLDDLPGPARLA